jgi:hypothetical protein
MVLDGVTVTTGVGNGLTLTTIFFVAVHCVSEFVAVKVYVDVVVGETTALGLVDPTFVAPVDH